MNKISFHVLRVGTAITFLWIGILIFQNPDGWGRAISPWMVELLPMSVHDVMVGTAVLDMSLGALLLIGFWTPWVALVATLHLAMVLIVSGVTNGTVRDFAIIGGTIALFLESVPPVVKEKMMFWRKADYPA